MDVSSHLVLVGAMGVGKTTVGELVAARLGRPFRDSDRDLEAAGRNARDIAQTAGVDALHRWEADHLLLALGDPEPVVLAAAASVVDEPRCVAALGPPFTVWLWAPAETLVQRMTSGDHRRDLGDDPLVTIAALAHRRDPAYRQVADVTVDVGQMAPELTVEAVVSRYQGARHEPEGRP